MIAAAGDVETAWAAGMRVTRTRIGGRSTTVASWYPAAPGADVVDFEYGGMPATFRLGGVVHDAPPVSLPRPRPLVLLAAGVEAGPFDLGWLGVHLARRGNVAVATEGAGGPRRIAERLRALADWLVDEGVLTGCFETSLRVVAGFDVGGITALALAGARLAAGQGDASIRDRRVCAVAALNPCPAGLLARTRRMDVAVPVHIVVSAGDRDAPPAEHGALLAACIRGARVTRLAAPAGHHVFRGEATREGHRQVPALAVDAPVVHRGAVHERTAALVDALVSRGQDVAASEAASSR